jgi:uncharacterized protein YrrD
MALTKEFKGKLLISNTDGKNLGEIKDSVFTQDVTQVVAVYLGKTGILNRKAQLLDWKKVALFGVDAWLIAGSDTVKNQDDFDGGEEFVRGDDLRGREIQTDGGTKIARVEDIILDNSGKVVGFALDKVYAEGPLAESKQIARAAIFKLGDAENPMITILEQAESLKIQ